MGENMSKYKNEYKHQLYKSFVRKYPNIPIQKIEEVVSNNMIILEQDILDLKHPEEEIDNKKQKKD